jgi:TolB-like protein/Tfp pilus assembly protein PilF
MDDSPISFGPYRLDFAGGALLRDGAPVALGQRAMALLQLLAQNRGKAVSKAALMDRGWPGISVEEGNLTVQISALRKALGKDDSGRDWIVTIPRVGYQLAAKSDAIAAKIEAAVAPNVAVLPFQNIGGGPEQDYFADGIAEDIINGLSRFKSFAVIARNSSFSYRGGEADLEKVAGELGVRYVLLGSVRRSGGRLRISAQLVDAVSGAVLWSSHFDGATDEVFDFQDRITESVVTVVAPQIQQAEIARSRRERPGSVAAYDLYLQALPKLLSEREPANAEAFALLTTALKSEPNNPLLLSLASFALEHRCTMGWVPLQEDDRQRCRDLAERGLEHAAGDAVVLAHCGMSLLQGAKEYDWGMAVLRQAYQANPNHLMAVAAFGVGSLHCGSIDDAIACFHRAQRLSPRDPFAHVALCGLAHAHMVRREFAEARDWAAKALALNPNFDPTWWMLIAANAQLGLADEARRHLKRFTDMVPGISIAKIRDGQPSWDQERMVPIYDGLRMAGMP